MTRKLALAGAILAIVVAFFVLDLDRWLTLEGLKAGQVRFEAWRAASPVLVAGAFFVTYVLVTALSLPGAAVMTLAAGALFGLLPATVLVSFASSIGATLALLVSRFLLGDAVQRRFGHREMLVVGRDDGDKLHALRLWQRRFRRHHAAVIVVDPVRRQVQTRPGASRPLDIAAESAAHQLDFAIQRRRDAVYRADKRTLAAAYHAHPDLAHCAAP